MLETPAGLDPSRPVAKKLRAAVVETSAAPLEPAAPFTARSGDWQICSSGRWRRRAEQLSYVVDAFASAQTIASGRRSAALARTRVRGDGAALAKWRGFGSLGDGGAQQARQ